MAPQVAQAKVKADQEAARPLWRQKNCVPLHATKKKEL
jgi:hypothetical protein